ncbi:cyclic nucleotide-binding domain-containing protein [Pseudochelatococcus sp. G4_1912]|uniref:cyclic nucleotide-binding domain-containing protein n=1 Tax=Pseudochelatococcus sp. G4_1912 TaxID=3114288 RepID=UPI0039C69B68
MALNDEVAFLSMTPVFKGFERDALRRLALSAQTRLLRAGEVLYRQGDPAEGGFVIMSGRIDIESALDGKKFLAGAGDLLGELSLIIETQWPSTAIVRDSASVMRISRSLMLRILAEFPASAVACRDVFARRLGRMSSELEEIRQVLL